jgi:predicted esterase
MEDSDFLPDVVVGTSQGGALVMQVAHNYPHSKFVLGAPAWQIFGADPSGLPKDTIVIQGMKDRQVLPRSSFELKDRFDFELRTYNFGHTIPTNVIKDAVDTQLKRLGMPIPSNNPIGH